MTTKRINLTKVSFEDLEKALILALIEATNKDTKRFEIEVPYKHRQKTFLIFNDWKDGQYTFQTKQQPKNILLKFVP